MNFKFFIALIISKILSLALQLRNGGTALPGLIALKFQPNFIACFRNQFRKGVILVSGTNGKTTTTALIKKLLLNQKLIVIHNAAGSNLLRGIASSLLKSSNLSGKIKTDWGVFEVDEATLPSAIQILKPEIVLILNLFRDQLDRYGEIDSIAQNWERSLETLSAETCVILNADDPVVAILGKNLNAHVYFYGLNDREHLQKTLSHFADSILCPSCRQLLVYDAVWYSHLGIWRCQRCHKKRPLLDLAVEKIKLNPILSLTAALPDQPKREIQTKLEGIYNASNLGAVLLISSILKIDSAAVQKVIADFQPTFGRLEEFTYQGQRVKILLSKNPTGFTESIRTLLYGKKKNLLLVLNDKIADGTDVSWIYDVDFELLKDVTAKIIVSGTRAYDLALRLKYADLKTIIEPDLKKAIQQSLANLSNEETLFILATYTAMLRIRKILKGRSLEN